MTKISIIDPSELKLNIMGIQVTGFSKGTFITIRRSEPIFNQKKSLKGKVQLRKTVLGFYSFTFTLDNSVAANTWIHTIAKLQHEYGVSFPVPVLFRDKMGYSTFFCKAAYIEEPETSHGDSVNQTEWTLICNDVSNVIGGNQADDALANIISSISTFIGMAGAVGIDLSTLADTATGIASQAITSVSDILNNG